MDGLLLVDNGCYDIPPGRTVGVVTFMEMRSRPVRRTIDPPAGCHLVSPEYPDLAWYRGLQLRIGMPWLWTARLEVDDFTLDREIHRGGVEIHALEHGGEAAGIIELDRRTEGEVELVYFGVTEPLFGTTAGRWLMERALDFAFADGPTRLWLRTDSRDHQRALPFYLRTGFMPYRMMVEIGDDPRLKGRVPVEAAAHIPILRPPGPPVDAP